LCFLWNVHHQKKPVFRPPHIYPQWNGNVRWKSSKSANNDAKSAPSTQWQLMSAICLERRPVITQEPNEMEIGYAKLMAQLELEHSLKCDHEMRHQEDLVRAEQLKRGELDEGEIFDSRVMQTAQDLEDAGTEELNKFPIAPRTTEADTNNDQTSIMRALDKYLILVVRQKLGSDTKWVLPQGAWQQGETMRQTAERVLTSICGNKIKARFLGNAPCGFYKYKFPRQMWGEGKPTGAKVFFFKAQYMDGDLEPLSKEIEEFKWLRQDEMKEILRPSYFDAISGFLIDTKVTDKEPKSSKPEAERLEN